MVSPSSPAMNVGYGMQCAWVTEDALLYGIDCICNNDLLMLHGIYIKIKSTEKKKTKKKQKKNKKKTKKKTKKKRRFRTLHPHLKVKIIGGRTRYHQTSFHLQTR